MQGDVIWKASGGSTIKAILNRTSAYTPNLGSDEFFSAVTGGGVGASGGTGRASAVALTLIDAASGGVCDANDIVFPAVTAGAAIQEILLFKDGGTDGTSPLLVMIDTATGLPMTPSGSDVTISWDNGASRVFSI